MKLSLKFHSYFAYTSFISLMSKSTLLFFVKTFFDFDYYERDLNHNDKNCMGKQRYIQCKRSGHKEIIVHPNEGSRPNQNDKEDKRIVVRFKHSSTPFRYSL